MFSIYLLDSSKLFQWDLNRKIKIIGKEEVDEVHFSHIGDEEALVVKPIKENNFLIANIPNILLQEHKDIFVYLVSKDKTLKKTFFKVGQREKPTDYLYTEIDILNYSSLEKRLVGLEEKLNDISEVKPQIQSDWNQNDEGQSDYIKNRPFYHLPSSPFIEHGAENAIESIGEINKPILIQDLSKTNQSTITNIIKPNILEDTWEKSETNFTGYNFIGKVKMYWKKYGIYLSSTLSSGDSLKNYYTLSFIDDYNFEYAFNTNFKFTFITKLSTLDEANKILYPVVGVYITGLDTNKDGVIVNYVSAGVVYTNTLNEVFLKSNIARKSWVEKELVNKITSPLTASVGQTLEVEEIDDDGKPTKWKAVDKPNGVEGGTVEITDGEPTKENTVLTLNPNAEEVNLYTAPEIDEMLQNFPSGGSGETWRTIREFDILNEEGIANDNSGITWTVDDSGNITAFEFDTDADGQTLSANKLRWCICPLDYQSNNAQAIFGGKRGYLHTYCNIKNNTFYSGTIYNATNTISSYRLESVIESDMSGILRQTTYSGCDRNSYGNDKVQFNFFTIGGQGYAKPPIQKFKIACDTGIWFVKGAKVLVQVCEEVG